MIDVSGARASWWVALVSVLLVTGCKDSGSAPAFSIELTPPIMERGENESFEVTLTITSTSGSYDSESVQLDVVQEQTTVIDELTEGDVRAMVQSFEAVDPDASGLGSRWKRMRWSVGDGASRQQTLSWTCAHGVARLYFFVEVDGKKVRAPTGATWQVAEPWGELEPGVADLVERELDLAPSTELEVLPIGCGETPPDPPPPPQPPDPADAGPSTDGGGGEGGTEEIAGGEFLQYGLSEAGTVYFVRGGLPNELVWWQPDAGETVISEGASLEEAYGAPGPYVFSELTVTPGGAAAVRVGGSSGDCVLIAHGDEWNRVLCIGDTLDGGETITALGRFAAQGRAVAEDGFGANVIARAEFTGSAPGGSFLTVEVFDGGLPLQQYLVDLVADVTELTDLDDATDPRIVSGADNVILGPRPGARGRAIDGTVALYSRPATVLAWTDKDQSGGPIGSPAPPQGLFAAGYSFDNQPVGGLTVSRDSLLAYLVKFIDVDGALLAGSGIYVTDSLDTSELIDLSAGLPVGSGTAPIADFGGLPAIQYTLVDEGVAIINARVDAGGVVGGIWRADEAGVAELFESGSEAPGRVPGTNLGGGIRVDAIGSMVVNPVGLVAFSAALAGPGVDATNDGAIYIIDGAGDVYLLVREGDPVTINGVEYPIDTLDMVSGGVQVPPLPPQGGAVAPPDFHAYATRDTHVVSGPGSDGRGTSFTSEGCGKLIYRAGNFAATRDNVLRVVALPCP